MFTRVQAAAPKQDFVTDFGMGKGEKHYNRHDYLDECKRFGRDPIGLTFSRGQTLHGEIEETRVGT